MSSSLRKLLICPWFGPLPEWYYLWRENIERLKGDGYDVLLPNVEEHFAERVSRVLNIEWPAGDGRKVCDFRCAFGLIYEQELRGYDWWGHTDLDMVYGRVDHFLTDGLLDGLDLFSNHDTYVSGPWSLYRNVPYINRLFEEVEDWRGYLENPTTTGWVETAYSRHVDQAHKAGSIRRRYESWQAQNLNDFTAVHWDDDRLMEGREEVMVAHFRRTKVYPPQLR